MVADRDVKGRLTAAAAAFASNARNPNLRRAQLSFLGAWTSEWAFTVGLGIVAYRDGGPTAVGLVALLRMVPAAVVAPLAAPFADRGRRERVLAVVSAVRGVATAVAALIVGLDGPLPAVYALAVFSTIAGTLYRPAHSALLPSLCRTGYELASANMVRGLLDSAATLVGPLLAAVLLTHNVADPGFSTTGDGGAIHNLGGKSGAWLSDLLLMIFGVSAGWWPSANAVR